MENAFFRNTAKDIASISPILQKMIDFALDLGVKPDGVNLPNAWGRCEKVIREKIEADNKAKELGYMSLAVALKALGQIKKAQDDLSNLPEVFHSVPNIWLSGKVDTRKQKGFKPVTLTSALRKHRVIMPLLIEAWSLAENEEPIKDAIVREYLSTSGDDFEKALYRYIYDLEEITLEEEFDSILPATDEDIAASLKLATDPNRIYGVIKKADPRNEEP
jgi:hypothetical protein